MATILAIDDEPHIRDMLVFILGDDYDIHTAGDSKELWQTLGELRPDIILLDWMLPDISGVEILKRLRKDDRFHDIPVIMLTAKGEENDKVAGLDAGADDYLPKPFSVNELKARIRALLRRAIGSDDHIITYNDLQINTLKHSIHYQDQVIEMGPTEFKLLCFLAAHPGRVYSRAQLLDRVWGSNVYIEERTVDVHVLRLRKVLKSCQADHLINTVRGVGYKFGD